jgi:hypothetical protein
MTGECLRLVTDGDPLSHGELAAGIVNSYGARRDACDREKWPSNASTAQAELAKWHDQDAVARAVIARVMASPASAENLAGVVRGSTRIAEALRSTPGSDPRHQALLRLALDVDATSELDVGAVADDRGTRATAVTLRWSARFPNQRAVHSRAIARTTATIDQPGVVEDLARLGEAARPVLSPDVRARLIARATESVYSLSVVVTTFDEANVELRPYEKTRIARVYDKLCEEPDRRTERAMGEFFTMWHLAPEGCEKALAWLASLRHAG